LLLSLSLFCGAALASNLSTTILSRRIYLSMYVCPQDLHSLAISCRYRPQHTKHTKRAYNSMCRSHCD